MQNKLHYTSVIPAWSSLRT